MPVTAECGVELPTADGVLFSQEKMEQRRKRRSKARVHLLASLDVRPRVGRISLREVKKLARLKAQMQMQEERSKGKKVKKGALAGTCQDDSSSYSSNQQGLPSNSNTSLISGSLSSGFQSFGERVGLSFTKEAAGTGKDEVLGVGSLQ